MEPASAADPSPVSGAPCGFTRIWCSGTVFTGARSEAPGGGATTPGLGSRSTTGCAGGAGLGSSSGPSSAAGRAVLKYSSQAMPLWSESRRSGSPECERSADCAAAWLAKSRQSRSVGCCADATPASGNAATVASAVAQRTVRMRMEC